MSYLHRQMRHGISLQVSKRIMMRAWIGVDILFFAKNIFAKYKMPRFKCRDSHIEHDTGFANAVSPIWMQAPLALVCKGETSLCSGILKGQTAP